MNIKRMLSRGLIVALCLSLWPALASAEPPKQKVKLVY